MSTHMTEDRLLAHLDGELSPAEARAIAAHLAACEACTVRFAAVSRRAAAVREALRALDVPLPWRGMPERLRAAVRDPAVRPIDSPSRRGVPWWRRPIAVAAGFVLLAAAGASAIPGSPLRAWIADSAAAVAALFDGGPGARDAAPSAASPQPVEAVATVSVRPEDGRLNVQVRAPRPGARGRIRAVAAGPPSASAASARYEVAPGRIDVLDLEGELLVSLPEGLREATVEVDGRRVAVLRNGVLRRTAAADSLAPQILVEVEG